MAKFIPGESTEVAADEPQLDVLVDGQHPLKPGKHVFQLVVTDDAGNESEPANVTIVILDRDRPTAVVDVLNAAGERFAEPRVELPFGQRFALTAERSTDVGGTVRAYRWTLLQG